MRAFHKLARRWRGPALFLFVLFTIEFLDEFVYGAREAAWPLIKSDLRLSYEQIGIILSAPSLIGYFFDPIFGILGDMGHRRSIIIIGGILFAFSVLFFAISPGFISILLASILLFSASGAFVSLSQSTLMDTDSTRHEQNMARWTFAGSVGVVAGSILLGLSAAIGEGWRGVFLLAPVLTLVLVVPLSRLTFPAPYTEPEVTGQLTFKAGLLNAMRALLRGEVLRWLILLQFSNLMLDILYGYLALYFADVVGVSLTEAALAISIWTVVGLLGDFLLIPMLERVRGLSYLRISALLELILFPAFLIIPNVAVKLAIVGALGFFNSGWYAVLQGQLYSSMPGQSGTVMAVEVVPGLIGSLLPLGIGFLAERFGLGFAIWWLMLGPIALLIGLPHGNSAKGRTTPEQSDQN